MGTQVVPIHHCFSNKLSKDTHTPVAVLFLCPPLNINKNFKFIKIRRSNMEKQRISNQQRPCTDRRRRSGAQTSGTDVKRSRTGRRSVRVPRRTPPEGEVLVQYYPALLCSVLSPQSPLFTGFPNFILIHFPLCSC